MLSFYFQVLQYNHEERSWLQIGSMERKRSYHAIVEANLDAVCAAVGNLNPSKRETKSQENHHHHHHLKHHTQSMSTVV